MSTKLNFQKEKYKNTSLMSWNLIVSVLKASKPKHLYHHLNFKSYRLMFLKSCNKLKGLSNNSKLMKEEIQKMTKQYHNFNNQKP